MNIINKYESYEHDINELYKLHKYGDTNNVINIMIGDIYEMFNFTVECNPFNSKGIMMEISKGELLAMRKKAIISKNKLDNIKGSEAETIKNNLIRYYNKVITSYDSLLDNQLKYFDNYSKNMKNDLKTIKAFQRVMEECHIYIKEYLKHNKYKLNITYPQLVKRYNKLVEQHMMYLAHIKDHMEKLKSIKLMCHEI